jgi:hypothetical protein
VVLVGVEQVAAALLAAATLQGYRLRPALRSAAWRIFSPLLSLLRNIHSGRVGDYALWFMSGAAAMAAAFFLSFA